MKHSNVLLRARPDQGTDRGNRLFCSQCGGSRERVRRVRFDLCTACFEAMSQRGRTRPDGGRK